MPINQELALETVYGERDDGRRGVRRSDAGAGWVGNTGKGGISYRIVWNVISAVKQRASKRRRRRWEGEEEGGVDHKYVQ